ncbi:DUF6864 domain-containing function [Pseudomonas sp. S2_H10]
MSILNVKTKVGNLAVVHTGVAHLHGSQSFEIDINSYICTVKFVSDPGGSRYVGTSLGTSYLVSCYNHLNNFGEAIFTPFAIGQLNGKTIYMTYYTTLVSLENSVRRFEYSLWMES